MTRRALLAAIAVAALATSACGRHHGASRSAPIATRIISLAPSITEALFAIGAGDMLVGRSRFCDYPAQARTLPVVGDVNPDLEAILGLHPDLVVGLHGVSSALLADQLEARKIATWFPDTGSLAAIDALLVGLGERVGRKEEARRVVDRLDANERAIERAVSGETRPRVLLVVSLAPVVVAGPKSFADELIREAGARNAVVEGDTWPTVGFETIVELDPDVVLDASNVVAHGPTAIVPEAPGWSGVRAVREGRVLPIRDERILRAGPRIVEGLAELARTLHPRAAVP